MGRYSKITYGTHVPAPNSAQAESVISILAFDNKKKMQGKQAKRGLSERNCVDVGRGKSCDNMYGNWILIFGLREDDKFWWEESWKFMQSVDGEFDFFNWLGDDNRWWGIPFMLSIWYDDTETCRNFVNIKRSSAFPLAMSFSTRQLCVFQKFHSVDATSVCFKSCHGEVSFILSGEFCGHIFAPSNDLPRRFGFVLGESNDSRNVSESDARLRVRHFRSSLEICEFRKPLSGLNKS